MKRGIAVAAVLATGCLSVPPYQPEALVSYTETGTAIPRFIATTPRRPPRSRA